MTDPGNELSDDKVEAVECNACGTKLWGVDESECKRLMGLHVLEHHEEEAPEPILEQAREYAGVDA